MGLGPGRLMSVLGPPTKPLMHRYWQFRRGMTLGVRCVAINADNEVCLIRHTYAKGWTMPGGGVDPGETIYEAAARELLEETGIAIDRPAELFGFYANKNANDRDHVALMVCRHWHQQQEKKPDHEIAEVGFFPVGQLPDDTVQSIRSRLNEYLNGADKSEIW